MMTLLNQRSLTTRGLSALALLLSGCTGVLGGTSDPGVEDGSAKGEIGAENDGTDGLAGADSNVGETGPLVLTRFPRLSHHQYDGAVRSLFGDAIVTSPSSTFLSDYSVLGFDNNANGLAVADRLVRDYQRVAEEISEAVSQNPANFASCLGAAPSSECITEFVQVLGRRAFRRPLRPEETKAYVDLFLSASSGKYEGGDSTVNGVRLTVETMLQSPHFLYRVELSETVSEDGRILLTDHEIAARLALSLWHALPDAELDLAADAGQLHTPSDIRTQATRMLNDPRAREVVSDFHAQWLEVYRYTESVLVKSAEAFPAWDATAAGTLREEATRFVDYLVFDERAGFSSLLSRPVTFVNSATAPLYGVAGNFTTELTRVDLDPMTRAGFLTQAGFLAAHAYSDQSSPIHRGVFVQRKLLCADLPDPPPGIPGTPASSASAPLTNRARIEAHTGGSPCNGCHEQINPPGFALEHFDAIGRYREDESGLPVDAVVTVNLDGEPVAVNGAIELSRAIAESNAARSCYARNWFRYALGREVHVSDVADFQSIRGAIGGDDFPILDFLLELTLTRTFSTRLPDEE